MRIAIDVSPLSDSSSNKIRGVGSYTKLLFENLEKFDSVNSYFFFTSYDEIPENIDIIHYTYFDPFFLTLRLYSDVKTVVTIHDFIPLRFPDHFPPGLKGTIKWRIQKYRLRKIEAIITDSNSSKNDIVKHTGVDEKKIYTIYLSTWEGFKPIKDNSRLLKIKRKYNLPKNFILYVGDATWNKNIVRLVQVVKELNVHLVLVGKVFTQNKIDKSNLWNEELVKVLEIINNDKKFIRLGYLDNNDLACLYNLARLLVMPSYYEGFGLPVLEAMKCGCPVITSKVGSLFEVGGDAVNYIDPYNSNDIKNSINALLTDPTLRKKLSRNGLQQAEKFRIEKTIGSTIKVYENILQSNVRI